MTVLRPRVDAAVQSGATPRVHSPHERTAGDAGGRGAHRGAHRGLGLLQLGDGRWTAVASLTDVAVPPTIHALLAARLDRLDGADRAVLGRAAIVGQVFYLDAVRALSPEADRSEVAGRVQQLLRRDLIGPDRSDMPGQDAFRFHHALLREAAYAMLPKQTRAELHERFAGWLEEQGATPDMDEFAGYHLERAHAYRMELGPEDDRARNLGRRAADRLGAAARRARDRSDSRGGEAFFRRAAALRSPDDPRRGEELLGVGWALDEAMSPESAPFFEEALAIARRSGDVGVEMQASMGLALARWRLDPEGGLEAMKTLVDRAMPRLEAVGDARGLALAHLVRGGVWFGACRYGPARDEFAIALAIARDAEDGQLTRAAMTKIGQASLLGDATVAECEADCEEFERFADRFPSVRGFAILNDSVVSAMLGRFDEARWQYDESRRVLEEFRGPPSPGADMFRWRVELLAGDLEAAERFAGISYDLTIGTSDIAHGSTAAGMRALALVRLGRDEDARRWAGVCRETSASDDAENQFLWRSVEAVLLAREGRTDDALVLIAEALGWADGTDDVTARADVYLDRAEVLLLAGLEAEARDSLRTARDLLRRKGVTAGEAMVDRHAAALGLG